MLHVTEACGAHTPLKWQVGQKWKQLFHFVILLIIRRVGREQTVDPNNAYRFNFSLSGISTTPTTLFS